MSWSWEIDLDGLIAALAENASAASTAADLATAQSARPAEDLDADLEAALAGHGRRLGAGEVAGRVAERLAPGPGLAALLGNVPARDLGDHDLPAVAAGFRRIAAWATAAELSAVAQIASRSAARDATVGVAEDGRPAQVTTEATAEVALAEAMSQFGASWWTDLAVQLTWRLRSTGAALSGGEIDLSRARLIAEATRVLTDDAARSVEQKVLPAAGHQTTAQLRATLRRAVIAADPAGAEQRRKEAERRARVMLYPDEDGTAAIIGQRLPSTHAAAAMARIKAIARAWKTSGAGGGSDLLQAQVFIALLCGTLPYIPPAQDAAPDDPPSGDDHDQHPDDDAPGGTPETGHPGDSDPADAPNPGEDWQAPRDEDAPTDDWSPDDDKATAQSSELESDQDDERLAGSGPVPAWPEPLAAVPANPYAQPVGPHDDGRPASGLLDLTMSWQALAGLSADPGHLGRIGPITSVQARLLAGHAARDPVADWRVIVTGAGGQAMAVARFRRPALRSGLDRDGPNRRDGPRAGSGLAGSGLAGSGLAGSGLAGSGLAGRVTLTIGAETLSELAGRAAEEGSFTAAALRAAVRATVLIGQRQEADAAAGGCAHQAGSAAYRPPPRLQEFVIARDVTCRFPFCRQPAWRADLDHTIPHDHGGRTCSCNLGALCRTHHRLKQLAGWTLSQISPGIFEWITPAGRRYLSVPDTQLA